MRTDGKVVHLKAAPEQKPTSTAGRLPVALISVRDKAAQQLRLALQTLFDNADDSLFEIADLPQNQKRAELARRAMARGVVTLPPPSH